MWLLRSAAGGVHAAATALNNRAFDAGFRRSKRLARPVVSVGNLALGGTGKTPICIYLYAKLAEQGWHPSILLRGYSTGSIADEARLYARYVPADAIFVGADRYASGCQAEGHGCDLHILDDGFQHRQLHRDCDIVLIDCSDPWHENGWLREGYASLRRADILVLTRSEGILPLRMERILRACPPLPFYRATFKPVSDLTGRKAFAVCGIGNPKSFISTIERAGARVVGHRFFRDHHEFSDAELLQLRARADECGADLFITTEKDSVRIDATLATQLRIEPLPIRTVIDEEFTQDVLGMLRNGFSARQ
ncbi:MAG: tetraacyldisaccharide 4'-kinase [Acidobacteria bacterium]|nr:tetraacyldisaccharide 4'-kinase [Acidobacteriota bacterium]